MKTLQLSTSGQTVHTKFNGTLDCYVALAAGAVAVLTIADSWAWYSTAAMSGYGLHACISE